MAVINGKKYTSFSNVNAKDGVFRFGAVLSGAMSGSTDMAIYTRGTSLYFWNGTLETAIGAAGSGGVTTLDSLYDLDKVLSVDDGTVTIAGATALGTGNVLTLTAAAAVSGNVLQITNSGTGSDIATTSSLFTVSSTGAVTCASIADSSSNGTLAVDGNGSGGVDICSISTGGITLGDDVTFAAAKTLTIAGADHDTTAATITAGNLVMSDGQISLTNAKDAATLTIIANGQVATNVIDVNADGITSGNLLHLDSTEASFAGNFIDCYNGAASVFTIGLDGVTTIATTANSTLGLTVTGIQTSQTMVIFDNTSGVIASDKAILLLDAGGAVASGGNLLRVAPTGTPNAGAIAIEYVGASKTCQAMYIDGDSTAAAVVAINGGGALTDGLGVLNLTNDGNLATGGNVLNVTMGGTPHAAAIAVEIVAAKDAQALVVTSSAVTNNSVDIVNSAAIANTKAALNVTASGEPAATAYVANIAFTGTATNPPVVLNVSGDGKNCTAIYSDADPTVSSANYFHSAGALAADKATIEIASDVTACNADSSVVRITQDHTGGVAWPLLLKQDDTDKGFINFEGTTAADQTASLSTKNGDGSVDGPKNYSASAGWNYTGMIRCAINGTDGWIPYYVVDAS
jgi:hypothetical protein